MSVLRVLIVDDEEPARRRLERMIADIPDTEVLGHAGNGNEAIQKVRELQPDALLLDIKMPGIDGISLAIENRQLPPIVFVTAYDEHALEAFDVNAVDYLVKPVRRTRLQEALRRVRERGNSRNSTDLLSLVSEIGRERRAKSACRISVTDAGTVRFFDARQVTRFWAEDRYTVFHADGTEYMSDEPLSTLEKRLEPYRFLRVHRSELVNIERVKALHTVGGIPELELSDGQIARVSRRQLAAVREALGLR